MSPFEFSHLHHSSAELQRETVRAAEDNQATTILEHAQQAANQPSTLFPLYFAPDEPTNDNNASNQPGWGGGFNNSYLADWRADENVSNNSKNNTSLDSRQLPDQKIHGHLCER